MTKTNRRENITPDVRADEPERSINRFTDGLRRVLAAPKAKTNKKRKRHSKP